MAEPETVYTGIQEEEAIMTAFSLALREKVITDEITQDLAIAIYRQAAEFAKNLLTGDVLEVQGREPVKVVKRDQVDTGDKPDNLIIGG